LFISDLLSTGRRLYFSSIHRLRRETESPTVWDLHQLFIRYRLWAIA
jgi:hypothetical protein